MLLKLHNIARRIKWMRSVAILLAAAGLVAVVVSLMSTSSAWSGRLEPAIVVTLWGMMLFAFIQLFQQIPPPALPHDGFWKKLVTRIKLTLYSLMAFMVLTVSILLAWISIKILMLG